MTNEKKQEIKQNKGDFLGLLVWWKIDKDELQKQVDQYETLSFSKSARGQSVICVLISALLTSALAVFSIVTKEAFLDVGIFLILSLFIFRGHRWALVLTMIIWTFGKLVLLFDTSMFKKVSLNPLLQIVWWALFMHYFYLAFKVERVRSRIRKEQKSQAKGT